MFFSHKFITLSGDIICDNHPQVGTLGPDGGHLHISVANKERIFDGT